MSPRDARHLGNPRHYSEFGSLGSALYQRCENRALVVIHGPRGGKADATNSHTIVVKKRTPHSCLDDSTFERPSDAQLDVHLTQSEPTCVGDENEL
jgi:hypothetical protein